MSTKKAFSYSVGASIISGLLNFGCQIYFARILGIEGISDYAYAFLITSAVTLISSVGVNQVAIALGHREQDIVNAAIVQSRLMIGVATISVCLTILSLLCSGRLSEVLLLSSISVAGVSAGLAGHIFNIDAEANLHYGRVALIRSASYVLSNLAALSFLFVTVSPSILAIRDLCYGVSFSLLSWVAAEKSIVRLALSRSPWTRIGSDGDVLISHSWKNWISMIGNFAVLRADFYVTSISLGQNMFGLYYQMRNLVEGALSIPINSIQSVLFSHFSKRGGQLGAIQRMTYAFCVSILVAIIASVLASLVAPMVIGILLGPEWINGAPAFIGLAAYGVLRLFSETLTTYARTAFAHRILFASQLIWLMCLIVFLPLFTRQWGILGSGLASATAAGAGGASLLLLLVLRESKQALTSPQTP